MGDADPDEPTPEEMGEQINLLVSIFRTLFLDKSDDFEFKSPSFGGLADIKDRFARRLAAAAGIPMTRFWGTSPVGLNATGEGDMKNYAAHVAALQNRMLVTPYEMIDRDLGPQRGHERRPSGLRVPEPGGHRRGTNRLRSPRPGPSP